MKALLKTIPIILLSNLIYSAGVVFFVLPSGLITGGTTGIAIVVLHSLHIPIAVTTAVFNLAMFLLGLLCLGKVFALSTLVSTITAPAILALIQVLAGDFVLTTDPLISAVFGGISIGFSIAIVLKQGASTGGMEIPPLMLKKFFGIPVSFSMYVFDFIILVAQAFVSDMQKILYGLLLVLVYTITIDKVLAWGDRSLQFQIISTKADAIKHAILFELDRGVTLLHGQTGYLRNESDVLLCVISPRERHRMEQLIQKIDPHAFVILSQVSKVRGGGFTEQKTVLPPIS